MKKSIKLIILIFVIFVTSGCDVEYNLDIDNDIMKEKITFFLDNSSDNKNLINNLSSRKQEAYYDIDTNNSKYYEVTKNLKGDDNNKLLLKYNYDYKDTTLQNSNAIGECFYNKSVIKDDKYITLNTSKGLTCIFRDGNRQIDNLTVNIKTQFSVEENNADKVSGDTYTWNINDKNYNNKSIYMKINYGAKSKNSSRNEKILLAFEIFGTLLIIIILLIINNNHKKIKQKY